MHTLKDYLEDEDCPEEFKDLEVIYYAAWSDYEECGSVIVFKFFDELMLLHNGYSVMAENNDFIFDPTAITPEYLVTLKEDWDEHLGYDNTADIVNFKTKLDI